MSDSLFNGRMAWLGANLAAQRNNIAKILLRLRDIGVRAGTSLSLHRKFLHLMEQISVDREKELDIIHEIETVEKHHQLMRERRMLRRADDASPPKPEILLPGFKEKEPKRRGILTLFGILYLLTSKPIKHKNQDLTVD